MSPGVPLLTRTAPATAQRPGGGFSPSVPHCWMPDAEVASIPHREAGLAENVVLIRDFLDRKRVEK